MSHLARGFSGTIWSGRVDSLSAQNLLFKKVNFSLNPLVLLSGGVSVDLDIPKGDVLGGLTLVLSGFSEPNILIEEANLKLAADVLENYIPLKGIELAGKITTTDLLIQVIDKKPSEISGDISWAKAELTFSGQKWELGRFSVHFSTDSASKVITGQLLKTKNQLGLEGKMTLSPNGMAEFVGHISTDIDQSLYGAMALFNNGKPAGGKLPIKFKQKVL